MQRTTKIVATLGPASSDPAVLNQLVAAGIDVVRLNFSHGTADDHRARMDNLRLAMSAQNRTVGVMADLQGPKIRVGKFAGGKIQLQPGQPFVLAARCELGDTGRVGLDYPELVDDVAVGDVLLLDDGRVVMDVIEIAIDEIRCIVRHGTELSNNKGINKLGGGLSAPALTAKDKEDIRTAAALKVDYVAVSFPKSGDDMRRARKLLTNAGSAALIVAKIERVEAIQNLEDILDASDGVMVARGDLAVEVGDAAVPALQKRIIRMAREHNKFVITATQMMESMIHSPVPTVEAMARICVEAEKSSEMSLEKHFLDRVFTRIDQSIAMAALFAASHLQVKAIAALTESGSTALWMSRLNIGVPIYALTQDVRTRYKVCIFKGVYPVMMRQFGHDRDQLLREAEEQLIRTGAVEAGDLIVLTIGEPIGTSGGTNTLKIVKVGDNQIAN